MKEKEVVEVLEKEKTIYVESWWRLSSRSYWQSNRDN